MRAWKRILRSYDGLPIMKMTHDWMEEQDLLAQESILDELEKKGAFDEEYS